LLHESKYKTMSFSATWHNLLDNVEELSDEATLLTPLSNKPFRVIDTQEHRVLIAYRDDDGTIPLQRDQFETLSSRVEDAQNGFELDRLPPDAEPYATVLSLHPRFELDDRAGILRKSETPTGSPLVDAYEVDDDDSEREEPDIPVYSDALLLIDTLERHDPTDLDAMETPALVNLYTLLSDVQRNANDLRQDVRAVLLDRLHHDQPVSGQYGSVQRTSRRNRSLKDDKIVVNAFEAAGIERERLTTVDASKVDDALDVTELSESDVYEIEESEYVRKAEVDEEEKESRLQGLKDQLAATDENTEELQQEIEELEARIDDLTSFDRGTSFHTKSGGE
jgi:chaperonin cofactor prefoldin